MPRCELCDREVKFLIKQVYTNDEWLNVCQNCLDEGEERADAEFERQKDEWFDNPEKERDINEDNS